MIRTVLTTLVATAGLAMLAGADWLQFRGTNSNSLVPEGGATGSPLPVSWNTGPEGPQAGVAWKVPLPGQGVSGPIVVDGRVIVTCSGGFKQDRLHVICFNAATGQQLWQRQFWATGRTACHPLTAVAAPTPASDGRRVFAFFSCNDLICLDLEGNLCWLRGLTYEHPTAANDMGMASSPLVVGDTVVVQIETFGESFAAGLDTASGQTRWRQPREQDLSWCSPVVLRGRRGADDLLLLQSASGLTAHEPATGKQLWSYQEPCGDIASAVVRDGIIYVPSAGLTALRYDHGSHDAEVIWKELKLLTTAPSPVVYGNRLYVVNRAGALSCAEADTGRIVWRLRLKGRFWATPVAAGNHLYFFNQDGLAQVVALDNEQGRLVAENDFGEPILASPAVADGALYVRSGAHLWKIAH